MNLTGTNALRSCLQAAGGCLQHARGLLSLLAADASDAACISSDGAGRSITTTCSASMGRVVIQENLEKAPAPSTLYTKDNYQALSRQGWSLDACEKVLHKTQQQQQRQQRYPQQRYRQQQYRQQYRQQRQPEYVDHVGHALNVAIQSCTSMDELRSLVEQQAHKMTAVNMAVVIQKVPKVLLKPDGQADHTSAALLLDHMVHMLLPSLEHMGGINVVLCLSSFVKCRYTPPGDVLTAMLADLSANNSQKISQMNLQCLGALMMSISKIYTAQESIQWPVLQAVLEHTTARIEELNGTRKPDTTRKIHHTEAPRNPNSIAMLVWLFGKLKLQSPEYIAALHQWIAKQSNLRQLSPIGSTQLWQGLRSQFTGHVMSRDRTGAAADDDGSSPPAAAAAGAGEGEESKDDSAPDQDETLDLGASAAAAAGADSAPDQDETLDLGDTAAAGADSADPDQIIETQQAMLRDYFGPQTLDSLAAATAQLVTVMTEKELGHVLASIGALRYHNSELLAAAAAGLQRLYRTSAAAAAGSKNLEDLSILTRLSAAWLAGLLRQPKPSLLLPLWVAAVEQPDQFDGRSAGRLFRVTGMLYDISDDVIQEQRQLLREEIHRRQDRRGPVPESSSSSSSTPEWVAAVADSLPQRFIECKPREIAHALDAYSRIPGVPLHDQLFATAAKQIQLHAHMFTQFKDMEMVALAFERMNFKEGLPALKALQAQTERLAAGRV